MNPFLVLVVALLLLAAAFPYVKQAKHADTRMLAGYLVFISVFALASAVLYMLIGGLLLGLGMDEALMRPLGAVLFMAAIFVPAFLLARWLVKRPPRRPPLPD